MKCIATILMTLAFACAAHANDLSSLAGCSEGQIVQAAREDAKEYWDREIKGGHIPEFSDAYRYARGRAIARGLVNFMPATYYTNAFNDVSEFFRQEMALRTQEKR
jgi:hypothetical protein